MSDGALADCCEYWSLIHDHVSALCGFGALTNWCTTGTWGSGGSNNTAGCCGSCCNKSFDDDAFEEQVAKDMEKTRDPSAVVQSEQPTSSPAMGAPGSSAGPPGT
ncbi:hypothetical protein BJ165DRAFT_1404466 [Panaeolus papilionaceus]|nr:hypothetical protein BJ165DRAFT_1404466 [Panaeolus papilionaceus]